MRYPRLLFITLLLACAPKRWPPHESTLLPRRCPGPTTADSTARIRVILRPKDAWNSALSLSLAAVRATPPDSHVATPPYGVDSITDVAPGLYRLTVRLIGYHHPRDTIRVAPGESWCVLAEMVRSDVKVQAVTN
jgi:hypothetical protein